MHRVEYLRHIKKNKFKNKPTVYNSQRFRSQLEAKYAQELDWLVKAGEVKEWEYESRRCKFKLEFYGYYIASYTIDFRVEYTNGDIKYVETKGFETRDFKLKWNTFQAIVSYQRDLFSEGKIEENELLIELDAEIVMIK